jgi:hypothetical protein
MPLKKPGEGWVDWVNYGAPVTTVTAVEPPEKAGLESVDELLQIAKDTIAALTSLVWELGILESRTDADSSTLTVRRPAPELLTELQVDEATGMMTIVVIRPKGNP